MHFFLLLQGLGSNACTFIEGFLQIKKEASDFLHFKLNFACVQYEGFFFF